MAIVNLPPTYPSVLLQDTLACAGLIDLLPSFGQPDLSALLEADEEEELPCAA